MFAVPPRAHGTTPKEEPADPYPELAAQVLRFVGEFDGSRMDYGEDDAQAVENIAQQLHDPVQREEIRRLLQSFLDHADPEEEIAVDITLCMEQIAELPPALPPEQAQIEEIAGYLEEAGYAASSELIEEGLMDYRAHGGKGNCQDVADFIEREFLSEEPEPASLEIAKEFINDFCVAEYGSPADFSDLEKVGIAYTTVTDEEIPIQVNADLVHYRIERYLDGQFLERRQYESLDELIQNELAELDFDDLVSVSDEELESISTTPEQDSDDYRLLSRLKADCDYFLGAGGRAEKHLWAGNVREQIAKMWNSTPPCRKNRNGSHRRTLTAMPSAWSRLLRWWCTTTLKMALMNGWITKRWRRQNRRRRSMWPEPWRARMALPMMELVSMTFRRTDGCVSMGTSRMNGPWNRRNKPLPQKNRQPAQSRPIYSPKKEESLRRRRSAPGVSALPSRLCPRRSPGTSAMIFTSPMMPWATAPQREIRGQCCRHPHSEADRS